MNNNDVLASLTDEALGYDSAPEEQPPVTPETPPEPLPPSEAVETPETPPVRAENEPTEEAPTTTEQEPTQESVDWEKRYKDLQSFQDKKIAEANAKLEAYQELVEQTINGGVTPGEQGPIHVSREDLEQGIQNAPVESFHWALANRPDLIPTIISGIRQVHGNGCLVP